LFRKRSDRQGSGSWHFLDHVDVFVFNQVAGELETGTDVGIRKIGEVIGGDFVKTFSGGDQVDNLRYLNPRTLDARLPMADIGPN
jgi:hypothetical protein